MATGADAACITNTVQCAFEGAVGAATSAAANSVADSALNGLGQAINAALVSVIASLGTVWAQLATPDLVTFGGAGNVAAGDAPPAAGELNTVVGWIAWGALFAAVIAMIILGAVTAASRRQGEGGAFANRYFTWTLGVLIISGATSIVSFLLPVVPEPGTGTVSFITYATWWLAGSVAVITTIIAGAKVAVQQHAQAGLMQLQSLIVLVFVSLAGVALVGALSQVADSFSTWVLRTSMTCDPAAGGDCFASSMAKVLPNLLDPNQAVLGSILLVFLGATAVLVSLGQVALMVVRIAMLVLLAGLLPLAAAGASTETGRLWFRRNLAWLGAFLLYKPAAALIYAVAFQMAGSDVVGFDTLVAALAGLALMVVAIVALPVMMRFAVPAVSAVASGSGGGGAGLAAAVALPTGAISLGRAAMNSNGGAGGAGPSGSSGTSGASGASGSGSGSSGAPSTSGAGSSNPFAPPAPRSGGGAGAGAPAGGGIAGGAGGGAGAGAGAGGAGAGGAGAAGAGAAGAGAAGGATAGAAGGPVGMAAGAALGQATSAASGAVKGAADSARDAANQSSGEPTGASGATAPPPSRWNVGPPSGPSGSSGSAAGDDRTDEGDLPSGSR